MAKPDDTRCKAKVFDEEGEESRCGEPIVVDPATGNWLVWCESHAVQEAQARVEGGERLQRVSE